MSRRVDLPDQAEIHRAREEVLSAAGATGRKPTVVALAKKLGMSHSTFWRHFPDVAQNLVASARAGGPSAPEETVPSRYDQLKDDHAKLKRTATELEQSLEITREFRGSSLGTRGADPSSTRAYQGVDTPSGNHDLL
jgi:AcrR family transcriptional regulator